MAKAAYNIQLKGYVGTADFDRKAVDKTLAEHSGKPVNVLIDILGSSLATRLSISAASKQHGNVCVHFVSLNASAATIGSCCASDFVDDAWRGSHQHWCRGYVSRSQMIYVLSNIYGPVIPGMGEKKKTAIGYI